jgi:uncharacterized membrane protein YkvA (DUF1232 family)
LSKAGLWDSLRSWARRLKVDSVALYLAARDPRVPWAAKLLAAAVAAYAFSPIDLIPDFIPVLGLLDELVILPLGIALALRLVPEAVMADCRARATTLADRPVSRAAAATIIAVWVIVAVLIITAVAHGLA